MVRRRVRAEKVDLAIASDQRREFAVRLPDDLPALQTNGKKTSSSRASTVGVAVTVGEGVPVGVGESVEVGVEVGVAVGVGVSWPGGGPSWSRPHPKSLSGPAGPRSRARSRRMAPIS